MPVSVGVVVGVETEGGEVLGVEGGLEVGGEFLKVFEVLGGLWGGRKKYKERYKEREAKSK